MTDFEKRWENLTVEEAQQLNEAARLTCEYEATCQIGEVEDEANE